MTHELAIELIHLALASFAEAKAAELDVTVDLPEQTITVTLRREAFHSFHDNHQEASHG